MFPFSINARSQTDTSAANLLNSRTLFSRSAVHLFIISSRDFPLSIDGGGIAIAAVGVMVVGVAAANIYINMCNNNKTIGFNLLGFSFLSLSFDAVNEEYISNFYLG